MRSVVALGLCLVSCSEGMKGEYFQKGDLKYRVGDLDKSAWKRIGFDDNDLAWRGPLGAVLAMNATCKDYGDPSLEVLTNHMLMGFTDKQLTERKTFILDGRDALESTYSAKLDGVPIDITVVVLKKDGCVHDFSYIAPSGHGRDQRPALDMLVDGFTTGDKAPTGRTATVRVGTPEIRSETESPPEEQQQ